MTVTAGTREKGRCIADPLVILWYITRFIHCQEQSDNKLFIRHRSAILETCSGAMPETGDAGQCNHDR
jgi:hypothetical protein